MERFIQDLEFAVRLLWKDRGFTLTTLATLALCLAANTAIFAIVNAVLLRPLPFPEADRIVAIYNAYPGAGVTQAYNGVPDYYDRLQQTDVFEEVAMYRANGMTIGGEGQGDAERVIGMPVTPSFFRLLRVQPLRGQVFTEQEAEPGRDRKVVLTYGLWQRLFGGRDDAVGRDLRVGGVPYSVMGVLAPDFRFINPEVQLFTAVAFTAEDRSDNQRHSNNWQQMARLKPGATIQRAQSQIDAINARNLERFPNLREILTNARFHTTVADFHDDFVAETRRTLLFLWGGVVVVLLIGCVNVANLLSVRATARVREMATRAALGASLARLSRQLLTETLLLALLGGACGIALGWWALRAAPALGLTRLPRGESIGLDGWALAFTLGLVALVGAVVGLFPVLALRRANIAQIVREEGRSGTASRGARLARRALVTSQVAFALLLLVGAGLLVASFQRVLAIQPGFDPANLLTGSISLPASRYADDSASRSTVDRLLERVRGLPGVQSAGVTSSLPLGGSYSDSVILAEGYQMQPGESLISPSQVSASDGFFEAMGTRLVRGRFFEARDGAGAPRSLVIDERLAERFWSNEDPIGRRMYRPQNPDNIFAPPPDDQWLTVVGVVETVRLRSLVEGERTSRVGAYYFPYAQRPVRSFALAIRTTQEPTAVTAAVRRELAGIDPELPFYNVRQMTDRLDESLVDRRTPMLLAIGFAVVALFLAGIGIYGVLAYQVSQRAREIGIRMALGAAASSIFRMVLGEGALIVLVGAALGLLGSFLLRQTMQSQLYENGAMDPRVLGAVGVVLLTVALVACILPARRAARTDPVIALNE